MFELTPYSTRRSIYDPFNMFNEFFGDSSSSVMELRTDITDRGDSFVLEADLPGFKKDDIKIDLENDRLTIKAERRNEHEEKDKSYVRCERSYGSYARSFDISGIKAEGIKASYNDGVLSLTMPKKDVEVSGSRRLAIE